MPPHTSTQLVTDGAPEPTSEPTSESDLAPEHHPRADVWIQAALRAVRLARTRAPLRSSACASSTSYVGARPADPAAAGPLAELAMAGEG